MHYIRTELIVKALVDVETRREVKQTNKSPTPLVGEWGAFSHMDAFFRYMVVRSKPRAIGEWLQSPKKFLDFVV